MNDDIETRDILDRYEEKFEIEPDLATYRVDMQRRAYETLFSLLETSESAAASGQYLQRHLLSTLPYGSTADVARAVSALSKVLSIGFESLLRFLGSPDTPSQIALATSQRKESERASIFQSFDPLDRENIRQMFYSFYGDAKAGAIIEAKVIATTSEPDENLLLFPDLND